MDETHAAKASATELLVSGMNCSNCARHVAEAIQSVAGVRSANVLLEAGRATVRWQADATQNVPAVIEAVRNAGYTAKNVGADAKTGGQTGHQHWQSSLWVGVAVTVALMAGEWGLGLGPQPWFRWLSFALAGIVQVFAGAQFYRGAWNQLKIGRSNMDALVALGSTTAFGYSAWALLSQAGGHLYFMEAAAIISLISFGHWLEARVGTRASGTLKQLLQLAPPTARRIETAVEKEVPVAELQIGDQIALRPGDRVPVDGTVTDGESAVDEAMLTGESVPVDKRPGSQVYAGTVNLSGRLAMRVTAAGESTALAHIIAAVQRAQTSRADIQRLGDQVSSVFVPVVVAIAVAAALVWGLAPGWAQHLHDAVAPFLWHAPTPAGAAAAFIIAAAILIVACPCAMGLATPAAIMASANAAARRGILIRDGVALEKAGNVTAVIFDKTGTLTAGKPAVAEILAVQSSETNVQSLAAALAQNSNHPISRAVAAARESAGDPVPDLKDWREIRGDGVEGRVPADDGAWRTARFGSLRWLNASGADLAPGEAFIEKWSDRGATIVGLTMDRSLTGLFAVRDTVKPGAPAVIEQLHRQGLKTFLLTGDNALTAATIARETGIKSQNVSAEIRPEQKAEFVKQLQAQGERVAFVGDGLNDAPALEQADLGIAVSRASDLAREAADVVLLKAEIEAVPEALGLALATLRTIKQNLFWAFFYNALAVPLAALGFISPILCAAAMGVSDFIVIGNALRLLRWRR